MSSLKHAVLAVGVAVSSFLNCPRLSFGEDLPQKPVVAATVIMMRVLRWEGMYKVELIDDKTTLIVTENDPVTGEKDGIPVRQLSECKFELGGPKGLRIDFGYVSNEYSHRSRSTGTTLTFKGTRDGAPMCHRSTCYPDLEVGGSPGELRRVLRAIEFISENSCPLRKLPF